MARKTFISYKYSEARRLRDDIIMALGADVTYYKGEQSDSPDLTDAKTSNVKRVLKQMMWDTSVTIIILSPNMLQSKWIEWEIEYCLKHIKRNGRTSQSNGIVAVILKVQGSYDWFIKTGTNCHGNSTISYDMSKIFSIISDNHFNSNPPQWHCEKCKTYDSMEGSYISFVKEDDFLRNSQYYIENAYQKSLNDGKGYEIKGVNSNYNE